MLWNRIMYYCGSGSDTDFANVSVLAPVPDPDYIKHSFSKINCTESSNVRSSTVSQKVVLSFRFFNTFYHFCIPFYVGSGSKSGSGTGSGMRSGSAKA